MGLKAESRESILSVSLYLDAVDSSGSEIRLSCWEHLETGRLLSAQRCFPLDYLFPATSILRQIWHHVAELANAFEDFPVYQRCPNYHDILKESSDFRSILTHFPLVSHSTPPDNLSIQEFQRNEAIDVEVNSSDSRSTQPHLKRTYNSSVGIPKGFFNKLDLLLLLRFISISGRPIYLWDWYLDILWWDILIMIHYLRKKVCACVYIHIKQLKNINRYF